mmetsp:Transcript_55092/g.159527  ORF Transcript_55092/g.159527 Transcript_55092/m.159527 type:complete len:585 (+) Transcript_55092:229-1983(+)
MPPISDMSLRGVLLNLHTDLLASPTNLHGLPILLDASDSANHHVVLLRDAQGRAHPQLAAHDSTAHEDWILLTEDVLLVHLQNAWEDGLRCLLFLLLFIDLLHVLRELIEQVVDDIGGHDLHIILLRQLLGFVVDFDVESHDYGILRVLLVLHDRRLLDIPDMNLANANIEDRNLHILQEAQERLEGAERACLHIHAGRLLVETVENALEVSHLFLQLLEVVVRTADKQLGARDRILEARRADLDAHRSVDLLVVNVFGLDSQLFHGLRREQRPDRRHDGAADTGQHDLVAFLQCAIDQNDVDGRAEAFDVLDFDDCALQLLFDLELVGHHFLRALQSHVQKIGHPLASQRACGHDGHLGGRILVLPVQCAIQTSLVQLQDDVPQTLMELVPDELLLPLEGLLDGGVRLVLPLVQAVDLVQGDDEKALALLQHLQRLHGLGLQAVHDIDHQDRHVAQRRTSNAQVVEGFVARRVDDHDSRNLDVEVGVHLFRLLDQRDIGEEGRADLLRDTTSLTLLHIGAADLVQQLRLAGIDVTHDHQNRRPQPRTARAGRRAAARGAVRIALGALLVIIVVVVVATISVTK